HVFFYARNHAKFMKYAVNFYVADCCARQGRKQDSSQGVAQSCAIASFQRFYHKFAISSVRCHLSNFNARFLKFKHSFKPPFFMIDGRKEKCLAALELTSLHNRD